MDSGSIERVHKVQLLKEKWAKEKDKKAQEFKEKKEAELKKIRQECEQAMGLNFFSPSSSRIMQTESCDRFTGRHVAPSKILNCNSTDRSAIGKSNQFNLSSRPLHASSCDRTVGYCRPNQGLAITTRTVSCEQIHKGKPRAAM